MPALEEIETLEGEYKGREAARICVSGVWFRTDNLREIYGAFPMVEFYVPVKPIAPVYFSSPIGDGVVMPCRPPKVLTPEEEEEQRRIREEQEEVERIVEQARRENEEREAKERAERLLPFEGWLDGKTACAAGRIMRTMEKKVRYNSKVLTRTDYVKTLLSEGYLPRRFDADCYLAKADPDSSRCSIGYTVTKTEFDFACYLLEKKQAETVEEPETAVEETTVETTPDYAAFEAEYRHEYSRLYFCGKPYAASVDEFSERLKNDADFLAFLRGFNRYTQDCVSSDRECAAFVNVYNAINAA